MIKDDICILHIIDCGIPISMFLVLLCKHGSDTLNADIRIYVSIISAILMCMALIRLLFSPESRIHIKYLPARYPERIFRTLTFNQHIYIGFMVIRILKGVASFFTLSVWFDQLDNFVIGTTSILTVLSFLFDWRCLPLR